MVFIIGADSQITIDNCSPDMRDEKNRRMEFATNPVTILNSLENMGYKVILMSKL